VIERLTKTKTNLVGNSNQAPAEGHGATETPPAVGSAIKTLLVANKVDLPGANDRLEIVRELYGARFPIHAISAEHGTGLEDLRSAIYRFLNVIRVYTKQPGKPPDLTSPFTCPAGSTLVEMAALVHRDFAQGLKSARIWGTGVYDGQSVKRDHVLHDKDIVELHL
jgi:ribosome-interacting GTPase 1